MDENTKSSPGYQWGDILSSEIVTLTYPSGATEEMIKVEDMLFPLQLRMGGYFPDPRQAFPKIRKMKTRSDDILICAFPRSGQHLTFEIVSMLVNGKAEYSQIDKDSSHLELHLPEEFDSFKSQRILNTHLGVNKLPEEVMSKKCKTVLVLRNPKDVAVSVYNFSSQTGMTKVTWDDSIYNFQHYGKMPFDWFSYTLQWEQFMNKNPDFPIHVVYFEDIKRKTIEELNKLVKFLGVTAESGFIEEVATKINFNKMKTAKIEIRKKELESSADNKAFVVEKEKFMDGQTFKMYRKGEIGDWKNWFTVAQNEMFDNVYTEKMKNSSLKFVWT